MHPKRKQRWLTVIWVMVGVGLSVSVFLMALKDNINLYCEPSQIKNQPHLMQQCKRIGGLVKKNSTAHFDEYSQFTLFDEEHDIVVRFSGVFPDLFKDGQGIIARGQFINNELFIAQQVLAKHDEEYTPRPAIAPTPTILSNQNNLKNTEIEKNNTTIKATAP